MSVFLFMVKKKDKMLRVMTNCPSISLSLKIIINSTVVSTHIIR